eukprot:SAG11_NODE_1533_length_4732_cov_3.368012_3_plen_124_part_00
MLLSKPQACSDLVVFAGHALGWLTHGHYRPLLHGVRTHTPGRLSLIFFLRSHEQSMLERRDSSDASSGKGDSDEAGNERQLALDVTAAFRQQRARRKLPVVAMRWLHAALATRWPSHEWRFSP